MSRIVTLFLAILLALPAGTEEPRPLLLASTTSTENTGLFDAILPDFEKQTGIPVRVVAVGTGVLDYSKTERIMTGAMFVLLVLYVLVAGYSGPSLPQMAAGFVPQLSDGGAIFSAVAILGTTALWPNFFLESILVKSKGWTRKEDLVSVRRDLRLGYAIGGAITAAAPRIRRTLAILLPTTLPTATPGAPASAAWMICTTVTWRGRIWLAMKAARMAAATRMR